LIDKEVLMGWRTNSRIVKLRNLGRALGLNRKLATLLYGHGYETRYDHAFSSNLQLGDMVWDVGANVGYYTCLFAERVGSTGKVFAFEPSPANFAKLSVACAGLNNVELRQVGLGKIDCKGFIVQGKDELGATSRVIDAPATLHNQESQTVVAIRAGRSLIQKGDVLRPNAIKIDVEGFELEVMQGLGEELAVSDLRLVGVEVHFGILKERGMENAPQQIEQLLKENRFRMHWPDSSHIIATRLKK
jgi:FkbM family methyltransferase